MIFPANHGILCRSGGTLAHTEISPAETWIGRLLVFGDAHGEGLPRDRAALRAWLAAEQSGDHAAERTALAAGLRAGRLTLWPHHRVLQFWWS